MTNFEFYKDKIMKIGTVDIAVDNEGNVYQCCDIDCSDCLFDCYGSCEKKQMEFLYAEHKEVPKLTKKERLLCEILETGYIARDGNLFDDYIYYYPTLPERKNDHWEDVDESYVDLELFERKIPNPFSFIKWEDEEPWKVEDLLKLEVIEE